MFMKIVLIGCLLCLFLPAILCSQTPSAAAVPPATPGKTNIAVMNLKAEGTLQSSSGILSDRLRAELFNTGKFLVMERGEMDNILKEQGFQQSGVCDDKACIVEMGQLLGVEKILAGSIGQLGTVFLINLRVIDVKTGAMIETYSGECRCPMEDLAGAMKTAAAYFVTDKKAPQAAATAPQPEAKPSSVPATAPVAAAQPEPAPSGVPTGQMPWSVNRSGIGVSWVVHDIDPEFNQVINFLRNPKPSRGLSLSTGNDPSLYKLIGFEIFYHKAIRQNVLLKIAVSRLSSSQETECDIIDTMPYVAQSTSKLNLWNDIVQFPVRIGFAAATNPRRVRAKAGVDLMLTVTNYSMEINGNHDAFVSGFPALNVNETVQSSVNVSSFALGLTAFTGLEVSLGRHLGLGLIVEYSHLTASRFTGTGNLSDINKVIYGEITPTGEQKVVFSEASLPGLQDRSVYFFKDESDGTPLNLLNIEDASVDLSGGGFRLYTAWYF